MKNIIYIINHDFININSLVYFIYYIEYIFANLFEVINILNYYYHFYRFCICILSNINIVKYFKKKVNI